MKTAEQIELQITGLEKHSTLINEILIDNGWENYCEELDYADEERYNRAMNGTYLISFNNELYFKE